MLSVFDLLSLPTSTTSLTAIRPTVVEKDDGSASPPRKVARLTADSDSASASRSKQEHSDGKKSGAPIKIIVDGVFDLKPPPLDKHLSTLRRCIRVLLTRHSAEILPATYERLYSMCRSVVTVSEAGSRLYEIFKMELDQCVKGLANHLLTSEKVDVEWIGELNETFKWFNSNIELLQSLLTYLDQAYLAYQKNDLKIKDLADFTVIKIILGHAQIAQKTRDGIETWLKYERSTGLVHENRAVIPALIQLLFKYQQYSNFEDVYLKATRSFYVNESSTRSNELKDDPGLFFIQCEQRIGQEVQRAKDVLPVSSWSSVREVTEKSLWAGRIEWLANTTVASYLDANDYATLRKMHELFSRVNGVDALRVAFRNYIKKTVSGIVQDADRDEEMVQRLLDFKQSVDKAATTSFLAETTTTTPASGSTLPAKQADKSFLYSITDSFAAGFKSRKSKPAEMIAKHLDQSMRKGQEKATDAEFLGQLDRVLALYRFTDDKDVFRTFYHRSLAKRLLLGKSASDDFEKAMLKKLKEQYDPDFGMGEDMFKDLALSRELMRDYHSRNLDDDLAQKLTVMVLQRSAWPFGVQKHTGDLPEDMKQELVKFEAYYKVKHTNRRLTWDHALGTAVLRGNFKAEPKDLSVSLYQALVLLLFNDGSEFTFQEIKEQTRMDDGELRRTLQSLACAKKKVLKKLPPGRDVDDDDKFRFNAEFTDERRRVHINSIQAKVSPEESKATNASIQGDRKLSLDAAIVRIMKAKKQLTYEQLKTATIDAVKSHFTPQVDMIKRRIDSLVESDYLERSQEDKTVYRYVA